MSTRRHLVEPDVDTNGAPVGEDVRRLPNTADSGNPFPHSIHHSCISFKPKEPTFSSVVDGRVLQTDDRLIPTSPKDGSKVDNTNYVESCIDRGLCYVFLVSTMLAYSLDDIIASVSVTHLAKLNL